MCERCAWCRDGGIMQEYHDAEWGTPTHDDRKHFEHMMLEAFQCGLSWMLMLKKREIFRGCMDGFDYEKIARYDEARVDEILAVPGMLKNRNKVRAAITNARAFIKIIEEFGSFDRFIWGFVGGKTLVYPGHQEKPVASNEISQALARELKRRGFKYLGPITLYSQLQAGGMINDHERNCYKYKVIMENYPVEIVEQI
jgi:DNA-3-methyladenine glycosylase I